ncbi:MAG: cardiolipin synthase [Thomasclavelia sp.]|nr:cardiolipin synthase [Thomasclavelia sp.]
MKKLFMNRIFNTGLLIIIQIIIIVIALINLFNLSFFMSWLFRIISFIIAIYIVSKDEDPDYKIIWIFIILIVPLFGGMTYILFGNKKPSRRLREAYEFDYESTNKYIYPNDKIKEINDEYKGQMNYLVNQGYPLYDDSCLEYYDLGDRNYPDLIKELKKAQHFIFMEYFIVHDGKMFSEILSILEEKVKQGVEVRFMYDDVGCANTLPNKYYLQLRKKGIQSIAFNPFKPIISVAMNNRDHRKITVIDGNVGFCGGFNLADEYINQKERFGHWKDTGVMIKGNATWNLTIMFLNTWHVATKTREDIDKYHPRNYPSQEIQPNGYILPYGDSPLDNELVGANVYLNLINQSKRYVYIDAPYLIINSELQNALINAAKRGVDIRIVTPGIPDKKIVFKVTRSYYEDLVTNGIKIYEYTPGFVHAKNFVVDDEVATVGTINLDYRSLYLHFECGVYMYKCTKIMDIKEDFFNTINKSHQIKEEDIKKGKFRDVWTMILRLIAPIL